MRLLDAGGMGDDDKREKEKGEECERRAVYQLAAQEAALA